MTIPMIQLSNGVQMPQEGFGVFQIPEADCEQVVRDAIASGYRLIDTASSYQNEAAVGRAIASCSVPREELFITTKAYIHEMGYENTMQAFNRSLTALGLDYLDFISFTCRSAITTAPGERWRLSTTLARCAPSVFAISCRTVCSIYA